MKIAIRVNADPKTGLGHITRCLSLAEVLISKDKNIEIVFLTESSKESIERLKAKGFNYLLKNNEESEEDYISQTIDNNFINLIFFDIQYNYSKEFTLELKSKAKVVFFHNYCEGIFYGNAFILPSAHSSEELINNENWQNSSAKFFHGFEYLALNSEVLKQERVNVVKTVKNIGIITGGSDPEGVSLYLADLLDDNSFNLNFTILTGDAYMHEKALNEKILASNISVEKYSINLLPTFDMAICTFGVSTYELLFLGIPIISLGHAPVNAEASERLASRYNLIIDLGLYQSIEKKELFEQIDSLAGNYEFRKQISEKGKGLVDGKGLIRIADILIKFTKNE